MSIVRKLLHFMFVHPPHKHHFSLHVERDEDGDVKPYWKCMFFFCDQEIEVTEWVV